MLSPRCGLIFSFLPMRCILSVFPLVYTRSIHMSIQMCIDMCIYMYLHDSFLVIHCLLCGFLYCMLLTEFYIWLLLHFMIYSWQWTQLRNTWEIQTSVRPSSGQLGRESQVRSSSGELDLPPASLTGDLSRWRSGSSRCEEGWGVWEGKLNSKIFRCYFFFPRSIPWFGSCFVIQPVRFTNYFCFRSIQCRYTCQCKICIHSVHKFIWTGLYIKS